MNKLTNIIYARVDAKQKKKVEKFAKKTKRSEAEVIRYFIDTYIK